MRNINASDIKLVILTASLTFNVILGLRLLNIPPDWFKAQVDRIESKIDAHLIEEECH